MKKNVVLIFSGYNTRAVIAFIRTLDLMNIDYLIITKNKSDYIYKTKYSPNILLERKNKLLNYELFAGIAEKLKKKYSKFIIAPSTEYLNRVLLEYREKLEALSFIIPLVNRKLYEQISDKYSFSGLCLDYGILVPQSVININDINLPCVAKPYKYHSKSTNEINCPVILLNEEQRDQFLLEKKPDDFFYQEYVCGQSIYLLYYFDRNGLFYKYSQQNFIQQPNGKSILLAGYSNFHESDISKQYEKMFIDKKFEGFVMIELKGQNDKFFMIEANPRFWGPSQYFVDSGFNLFENFLFDYDLISNKPLHRYYPAFYFWDDNSLHCEEKSILNAYHNYSLEEFRMNEENIKKFEIFQRGDLI